MTFSAVKDPDAILDYKMDWEDVMNLVSPADTISTSTWVASGDLTIDSDSNTTLTTTVWVSGGTVNTLSNLVNTIVTAGGRKHVKTIEVSIKDT
jgi:hypothetical protein